MTRRRTADTLPIPEYEVEQYFPQRPEMTDEEYRQLRTRYGYVRTAFKSNPERYRDLQRWLNQSRAGTTYDVYLTASIKYALVASLVGLGIGVALTWLLTYAGVLQAVESPMGAQSLVVLPAALVVFVTANKVLLGGAILTLLSMATLGLGTLAVRYYTPRVQADLRGRAIDVVLPHGIVYMYALSYGGMNFIEVMRSLAESDDYGDVAHEFDMIVRDMDLFGNDLFTALRNARNLTPSVNFEQFLDDLLTVLDTGGDVTIFLDNASETYVEEAMDEQEDFLETLSLFSEIFIAAFVAAPLLIIVTLMVISFLGGDTLLQLYALNYLVFPVGMALFLFVIHVLSQPYTGAEKTVEVDRSAYQDVREVVADVVSQLRYEAERAYKSRWDVHVPAPRLGDDVVTDGGVSFGLDRSDPRFQAYRRSKAYGQFGRLLRNPLHLLIRQPSLTLVITVPTALVVAVAVVVTGTADASVSAFLTDSLWTTFWLFVVPFFIVAVPLSAFHEYTMRRDRDIERRFPDTLNILSSANQMGIPLTDGLELVSRWSRGPLAVELRKLRNDVQWNHDTSTALKTFARRLGVPKLARIIKLIAEGGQSSGDLARVLSVAAEDTRNRYKLEKARRREMSSYIAIVLIGYLVYLFVILMLGVSYLEPLANLPTVESSSGASMPVSVGDVPIAKYNAVFFHSALIQGIGSGILAGKLADNDVLSGLKYSLALVALALLAFIFV